MPSKGSKVAKWQTLSSEEIYKTPWIRVRRDKVLNQNKSPLTYSVVELPHPSVFIVAMNDSGQILLQRAYHYPIDRESWDLPAGHSDGEVLLTAAQRELSEEAGFMSSNWIDLGMLYQSIGVANMPFATFLALDVQHDKTAKLDEEEDIKEHRFLSMPEIEGMIKSGDLIGCPTISALYLAKMYLRNMALEAL
jgi:8-oxo-dGTP pyrophosphatase MutT (NUDIX family)